MPYQLSEINEKIRRDPAAFLAECDAHYQERIHAAVDKILARMKESPIVLLSGPSGSGKTTTAMKVERELERRGVNAHTVSMDNYFKTLNRRTAPRTPEGDIDYESPKLLDMELLDETFDRLSRGEKKYISPYKGRAHVIIDSSLRYEVPVFAHYADALRAAVEQVPPDNERWQEYHDLVDAFRYFEPVDPALVAPDSLLREFIGGGSYHY